MSKLTVAEVPHPGEILREALQTLNLNTVQAAEKLHVSHQFISQVLGGKRTLSALMCLKLEKLTGRPAKHWMHAQADFSLWAASQNSALQNRVAKVPTLEVLK